MRALWQHLIETTLRSLTDGAAWEGPLRIILERGVLARRILRAAGDGARTRLQAVYRKLCDCLEQGRMFVALD